MLLYIEWNPDPIIFQIGAFAMRWYSSFFALGFIIGFFILQKIFQEEGENTEDLDKMLMYSIIGAILGARIGHYIFYEPPAIWTKNPLIIFLPFEFSPEFKFIGYRGLASHGGFVGMLLAYALLSWRLKKPALWLMDKTALVGGIGVACIRLGNLMNSEILGEETTLPWGFIFTKIDQIPRHPTQLYGAISYILLSLCLIAYYRKSRGTVQDGHYLGLFITILGLLRFTWEFFKKKQSLLLEEETILNMGQYLSLPMIILGLGLAWMKRRK